MSESINLDQLYKKLFVRLVAGLMRRVGIRDIALAEDIVQETFLAAHEQWKKDPPNHPEAWLFKVCKNIALRNSKRKATVAFNDQQVDAAVFEIVPHDLDEPLWMLAACANPRFSPKQQVIFALRYAVGFKVEQIALLLGSPPETITKTLQRIRAIIHDEKLMLELDSVAITPQVHATVLKILYLMFSEGYQTSRGESMLNTALCEDALSLTQTMVRDSKLSTKETKALYALMLFNLSRFEARFSADGEIIDLEEQDRSRWNAEMIALATHYLNKAKTDQLSTYHIEGAIAYMHSTAKSFPETDWSKIVSLYEQLVIQNESPFSQLNLAIARFYAGHFDQAMKTMEELGKISFINHYHLYHVAMGKMFTQAKQYSSACMHFTRAIPLTRHLPEKRYIEKLINRITPMLNG